MARRRHLHVAPGGSARDRRRARRAAERTAELNSATTSNGGTITIDLPNGVQPIFQPGVSRSGFVGYLTPDENTAHGLLDSLSTVGTCWAAFPDQDGAWTVAPLPPVVQADDSVDAVAVTVLTTIDLDKPTDDELLNVGRELVELAAQQRDLDAVATVEEELDALAAIPVHHTEVVDGDWDGNAAMTKATSAADYRAICAWRDSTGDADARSSYKFPHHATAGGPANIAGVRNGLSRLPQADIPESDRAGVERHLQAHLDDYNARREEQGLEPVDFTEAIVADAVVDAAPVAAPEAARPFMKRWSSTFAPEGSPTDDGRLFAPGSIRWRELPLTLMAMTETQEGHSGAKVAGKIERIGREGNLIRAEGYFDESEFGQEIARMVGDGILRGLSVDLAIPSYATLPRSKVLDEAGAYIGPLPEEERPDPEDSPSLLDILFGEEDEELLFVVLDGVIGMATVCPFPAFAEATIELVSSAVVAGGAITLPDQATWQGPGGFTTEAALPADVTGTLAPTGPPGPLTASAVGLAPVAPPSEWLYMEEPDGPCPLTVTEDGHVYGHAAVWGTCHIGIEGVCVEPPISKTDYGWFHLKEVACGDGDRVNVGTITLDTGHADRRLDRASATRHYDDTGTAVADVRALDGEHGIWVTGALRPDVDESVARKLSGAVLSGDWRDFNGNLELVALLAVNVPGFPVPRTAVTVLASAEGPHVVALVAAGINDGREHVTQLQLERIRAYAMADEFRRIAEDAER